MTVGMGATGTPLWPFCLEPVNIFSLLFSSLVSVARLDEQWQRNQSYELMGFIRPGHWEQKSAIYDQLCINACVLSYITF